MKRLRLGHGLLLLTAVLLFHARASAQFIDDFNSSSVQIDPEGLEGWMFRAGDLVVSIFRSPSLWWALAARRIERSISGESKLRNCTRWAPQ